MNLQQLIAEVDREVEMRRKVYPGRVLHGKMSQPNCDKKIILMDSVAAILRHAEQTAADPFQLRLPIRLEGSKSVISSLDRHIAEISTELNWREVLWQKNSGAYGRATRATKKDQLEAMRQVLAIFEHIQKNNATNAPEAQGKLF